MNVSASNAGEEHKYFIAVTPSVESGPTSFTTENSTFQLSVVFNQEYTVSVVANNCAGNSTPATTTFNISKYYKYYVVWSLGRLLVKHFPNNHSQ